MEPTRQLMIEEGLFIWRLTILDIRTEDAMKVRPDLSSNQQLIMSLFEIPSF